MSTREERYAARIAERRAEHPMLDDFYWQQQEERQRLQWQLDDLGNGVAELVGKYGFHAEQDPGNTRLAALVDELRALSSAVFDRASEGVTR